MRALPAAAAAALLALAAAAALAVTAAAESPARHAEPALLILRAACAAADPAAFSEERLRLHAETTGRAVALQHPFRILSYEQTCGPEWRWSTTRAALSAMGVGAPVALAGWGGGACGALEAAARALRARGVGACAQGRRRAAAVAWLAARLRWRRALLVVPPDRAECAAAMRDVRVSLAAAAVSVRTGPISASELTHHPQVVVTCASLRGAGAAAAGDWSALGAARHRPTLLLLHVDEPAFIHSNITLDLGPTPYRTNIRNLSRTTGEAHPVNANLSLFHPASYKKSFPSPPTAAPVNNGPAPYRNKRARYGVEPAQSTTSRPVFRREDDVNTIKTDTAADSRMNDSLLMDEVGNAKRPNASVKVEVDSRRTRRAAVSPLPPTELDILDTIAAQLDDTVRRRILFLSHRRLEVGDPTPSLVHDAYDEILEAVQSSVDKNRTAEIEKNRFFLYEKVPARTGIGWNQIAILTASSAASEEDVEDRSATVEVTNSTHSFERLSEEQEEEARPGVSVPILAWSLALAAVCAALVAVGSRHLATRRRRRRRRGDAVLAAAEFSFPADELRRVGEGMETMLSCWLQQLHSFGGPELERPDLLKQPAPKPAPSAPSSTCSINRVALDRRTRYKGDAVAMKYLPQAASLELRRKATDVLLVMQGLRHENLNPFIGCLCEVRPALVFDHCGRGSLEDVLMADEIKLDWTFRLSLLTDLVKGMRYLHGSPLRVHGRLSSRNCVVDSRWVLRLTDYGLPAFYRAQGLPAPERTARELLWTAPELLREGRGAGRGTAAGDVFSFAIIMQEVIVRGEPYCMLALTPDEIIEKVSHPPPLIRPSVSMGAAPPEAVSVMRQCWSEAPDLRPDFQSLHDIFRHLHRGRKINIVDSMFEMLEKYSNNLEELIRERTEQLDMEKKKTEQLLNRMLPRSVAERLMLGSRVEPEEFEEVSIYFSDIVGFTALAARSTPVQVVDLLNDLYTTFDAAIEQYHVYKVETIGDAYMVVGGLPARAPDHAERVATMALHLLHLAGRFRVRHLPATPLHLRSGLHTGPVCAAVVGLTMPRYCLFGDTVNTASRMESTGAAWRIQVSAATAGKLAAAGGYRLRSRGLTMVKGKGAMHTYWLLGKDGFDKPLPTPPPLESEEVLFETDGENESSSSSLEPPPPPPAALAASPPSPQAPAAPPPAGPPPLPGPRAAAVERQRSDPSANTDKYAWQRSGAVSADSSPPRTPLPPRAPPRAPSLDHSASYSRYRCLAGSGRVLRRQWSLERGEALAAAAGAAAAEEAGAGEGPPAALQPGAGAGAGRPAPAARYRTRPDPPDDDAPRARPP